MGQNFTDRFISLTIASAISDKKRKIDRHKLYWGAGTEERLMELVNQIVGLRELAETLGLAGMLGEYLIKIIEEKEG